MRACGSKAGAGYLSGKATDVNLRVTPRHPHAGPLREAPGPAFPGPGLGGQPGCEQIGSQGSEAIILPAAGRGPACQSLARAAAQGPTPRKQGEGEMDLEQMGDECQAGSGFFGYPADLPQALGYDRGIG